MIGPPMVPPNIFQRILALGSGSHSAVRRIEIIGPAIRIQGVVPEIVPDVAVETVRTGLDGRTDDAAHKVAKFGGGVVRDEVEFLDGIRSRGVTEEVIRHLVIVHTIEQEVVGLFAISVNQRPRTVTGGIASAGEAAGVGRYRAGRQQRQLHVIARGQEAGCRWSPR